MRTYQDRCDICGQFVEECSLVWVDDAFTVAACKKCAARPTPVASDGAGGSDVDVEGETRPAPEHNG